MALRRHHHFKSISSRSYSALFIGLTLFLGISIIMGAWIAVCASIAGLVTISGLRVYSIHPDYSTMTEWQRYDS